MVKARRPPSRRAISAFRAESWWLLPLILALAALVYSRALSFGFVYDDQSQIFDNPLLGSWRNLPRLFTMQIWGYSSTWTNYYRPVFFLWLMLNRWLWGGAPLGWHAVAVVLHLCVVGMMFLLVRHITRDRVTATLAAAVFAVHPVQVEAVAWISGTTDLLMALPFLGAFLAYVRWREDIEGSAGSRAASVVLFAAALLVKETALVLPLLLLAYEWTCAPETEGLKPWRRAGRSLAPFALVAAAYLVVRMIVLRGALGVPVVQLPLSTLSLTLPLLLASYVKLLVFPARLSAFSDLPYVARPGLLDFWLPAVALLALAAALWYWSRHPAKREYGRRPAIALATCWMVLPLLPVLHLRYLPEGDILHLRWLYLPSMGFAMLLAMAIREIRSRDSRRLGVPALQWGVAAAIVCVLSFATWSQSRYWRDNLALYQRGVEVAPGNKLVRSNLGNELLARGRYEEAVRLYREVLQRDPNYWLALYNLGYAEFQQQHWEQAAELMDRAIAINRGETDSYVYRGMAWLRLGRLREAEQSIREALARQPRARNYHFALGVVLRHEQRWADALEAFKSELALYPDNAAARQHVADLETRLAH